jgi:hypothetical protein
MVLVRNTKRGIFGIRGKSVKILSVNRSHRLAARTPGFHPGNRGSIPLGITIIILVFIFVIWDTSY